MKFDHAALVSNDIDVSIRWYEDRFNAEVLYRDETWGLIRLFDLKLSFVKRGCHPPHLGFEVDQPFIDDVLMTEKFKSHRDGSRSCYVSDPDGNCIEFLKWDR